jgi:hypothetical protein
MFNLDIVFYIIITIIFVILLVNNILVRVKNKELFVNAVQAELDRMTVYAKVEEMLKERDSASIEKTDGFLKFVSESREWAFKYIEEVQAAISEFDSRLGPVVKYYKETGKILHTKPSELVKELSSAYDKLMDSMPKEEKGSD